MRAAERLYRTEKVVNVKHDYMLGLHVQAEVMSEHPLQCKNTSKSYCAWVSMKPYTKDQIKEAKLVIRKSPAWQQVVEHTPCEANCLAMLKYAQVPFQLMEKLVYLDEANANGFEGDCSCPDFPKRNTEGWCKHIASLCYVLVDTCRHLRDKASGIP